MAAILGDLIQMIDDQSYLGQQVLNVYYYRITATLGLADGYLSDLNDYFTSDILINIRAIQLDGLLHLSREWRNLSNGVDLFADNSVLNGTVGGAATVYTPSFLSAGFMLQRESLATRNGYKRFAGISEANVSGNSLVGLTTEVGNLETNLAQDLLIGIIPVAEPVIVKRPINPPVESYVYASIGSASFRSVGTQNSRKAGRGV